MMIKTMENEMKRLANKEKAKLLSGFFKTGQGQYGDGDIFLGIMVPKTRMVAKKYYQSASLKDIQKLLNSSYHEFRLLGLIILTMQSIKADKIKQKEIFNFYLKNTTRINNWDLVDLSAPNIVGRWLMEQCYNVSSPRRWGSKKFERNDTPALDSRLRGNDNNILYKLACSKNLWEKRIAIISTFAFIRAGQIEYTVKIAKMLLNDRHDLIHKAAGWMLREVGKKNLPALERFLKTHYYKIPRTMLRYAIEKFPEIKRKKYLKMTVQQ